MHTCSNFPDQRPSHRPAAIRRQKPPVARRLMRLIGVVVAGFRIPEIAGELFGAVGGGRGALDAVGIKLADRAEAVGVDVAVVVLDQLASEVKIGRGLSAGESGRAAIAV